jgi:hypothetical protein
MDNLPRNTPEDVSELLIALLRERIAEQTKQMRAIDTNATVLLPVAGALLAAIAAWVLPTKGLGLPVAVAALLVVVAAVCLIVGVFWPRTYKTPSEPKPLAEYRNYDLKTLQAEIISSYPIVYDSNKKVLDRKTVILKLGMTLLLGATVLMSASLVLKTAQPAPGQSKGGTMSENEHPQNNDQEKVPAPSGTGQGGPATPGPQKPPSTIGTATEGATYDTKQPLHESTDESGGDERGQQGTGNK